MPLKKMPEDVEFRITLYWVVIMMGWGGGERLSETPHDHNGNTS